MVSLSYRASQHPFTPSRYKPTSKVILKQMLQCYINIVQNSPHNIQLYAVLCFCDFGAL